MQRGAQPAAQVVLSCASHRSAYQVLVRAEEGMGVRRSFEAACRRQRQGDGDPLQRIAYLARSQYVKPWNGI
jgi:hypothetical protein